MVREKFWEIVEVIDIDECDDLGSRFDQIVLDKKLAFAFQKYWDDRAKQFPEKFFWKKVSDPKLIEFYNNREGKRWEKNNDNGGIKK